MAFPMQHYLQSFIDILKGAGFCPSTICFLIYMFIIVRLFFPIALFSTYPSRLRYTCSYMRACSHKWRCICLDLFVNQAHTHYAHMIYLYMHLRMRIHPAISIYLYIHVNIHMYHRYEICVIYTEPPH